MIGICARMSSGIWSHRNRHVRASRAGQRVGRQDLTEDWYHLMRYLVKSDRKRDHMQNTPHPWLRRAPMVALAGILILAIGGLTACGGSTARAKPSAAATTGSIQIAVSLTRFNISDPIGVTVTNTSANTYYAVTGRSGCTFLQLQQLDPAKNSWVNVFGCPAPNPVPLSITPHISEPFTLAPNSPDNENAWDPGTFRVGLPYSTSSNGTTSPLAAFSAAFTIVSG